MNVMPQNMFSTTMNANVMHKNNQLLAGTQSMLNGISAIPQLNQLSVSNMTAITPIAKVKSFQFSNPNSAQTQTQTQLSPQFLPPLATTPRFTVPSSITPRNGQYHGINLNQMNMSNAGASNNGSATFQIPTSMLKNTSTSIAKKEESDPKKKRSLNAKAAPFSLNGNSTTNSIISPRNSSPRNFKQAQFVPPPPQSFAFPPPPIQQTANWLLAQQQSSQQAPCGQQSFNMSPMMMHQ